MVHIIALYPYYKLAYIELAWGAGKKFTKNWQDEARQVLEAEVIPYFDSVSIT
jgi:hypothetical protein